LVTNPTDHIWEVEFYTVDGALISQAQVNKWDTTFDFSHINTLIIGKLYNLSLGKEVTTLLPPL